MAIADPRDISGLVAWYSAEAETAYTDGAQMTGWTDLSGNSNNATALGATKPLWQATTGPAAGPAVNFQEIGYFSLPDLMTGAASGELMAMIRADSTQTGVNGQWSFGDASTVGRSCQYPWAGDGSIADQFGLGVSRASAAPTVSIADWRRYTVWSAPNDFALYLDGTLQISDSSTTVAWDSAPHIGVTRNGGNLEDPFKGWMGCVVLYDHKLTTTERADLETWMAANPSGGATAGLALTDALPALVDSMTIRSFTSTDTTNSRSGRIRGGYAIHADNTDPVILPAAAATRRDKALWYLPPPLDDGRPVSTATVPQKTPFAIGD